MPQRASLFYLDTTKKLFDVIYLFLYMHGIMQCRYVLRVRLIPSCSNEAQKEMIVISKGIIG